MLKVTQSLLGSALLLIALLVFPQGCGNSLTNLLDDCTLKACTNKGDTCDATSKKCVCAPTDCAAQPNSGCNPQTNSCSTRCTEDSQCASEGTRNKCIRQFCMDPSADQCKTNTDCKDPKASVCDTAKTPKVCAAPAGCSTNDDCKATPTTPFCNTTTRACVACLKDDDCPSKKCGATGACEASTGCESTAKCFETNKKTYCDDADKAKGCQEANASCSADKTVTAVDNSGWNGSSGGIIWGVAAQRITADSCWSYAGGSQQECADVSECSGADGCYPLGGKKYCGKRNNNGLVEISFNFYNPAGICTDFKCAVSHTSSGEVAEGLKITSGNENAGRAKFGMCIDNDGTFQFVIKDSQGQFSNSGCYSSGPR